MESQNNGTGCAAYSSYVECNWGDLIDGTKNQLQAMGLGIGLAYPGEVGGPGPRYDLKVRDPRGYSVRISSRDNYSNPEQFTAHLAFPNWPEFPRRRLTPTANGVKKREQIWFDEYIGSAQALADAGLVQFGQLPGQPGMRKTRVTILPDGTPSAGSRTSNQREGRAPGARWIERASASTYRVSIVVTKDEEERRRSADEVKESTWLQQVRAQPRPARLQPMALPKCAGIALASLSAARDIRFQCMLARLVSNEAPRQGAT